MKTIKTLLAMSVASLALSCGTYSRMVTTIDSNGEALREVYAMGDSAFMAGDVAASPFWFDLTDGWAVTRFDSTTTFNFAGVQEKFNVKISRAATTVGGLAPSLGKKSFATPKESLTKRFCWFYTYYTFESVYPKLDYVAPVSIDRYLTKAEQKLWTQGDMATYRTMNGMQLNEKLNSIDKKFMEWIASNCLEISLNCIAKLSGDQFTQQDRDQINRLLVEQKAVGGITPRVTCDALDAVYHTTRYSQLYKANPALDDQFESATGVVEQIDNSIGYSLVLPVAALSTNAPTVSGNELVWGVSGLRLLFDDYTLMAEYREANVWAFVVSGLVLLLAVVGITIILMQKKH